MLKGNNKENKEVFNSDVVFNAVKKNDSFSNENPPNPYVPEYLIAFKEQINYLNSIGLDEELYKKNYNVLENILRNKSELFYIKEKEIDAIERLNLESLNYSKNNIYKKLNFLIDFQLNLNGIKEACNSFLWFNSYIEGIISTSDSKEFRKDFSHVFNDVSIKLVQHFSQFPEEKKINENLKESLYKFQFFSDKYICNSDNKNNIFND